MRLAAFAAASALLISASTAHAWDWSTPFAVRDDADIATSLTIGASTVLPMWTLPTEVNGFGGRLNAAVSYTDDDKLVLFEIADVDFHMIYRSQRGRFDAGSFPTLRLFSFDAQLRLTPSLHLLYGAALLRSGAMVHASQAALGYHLGVALPLIGRDAETMRGYRRGFLQIEVVPLAGAFLGNLLEEGFFENEHPVLQVHGEVGLAGRLRTVVGTFSSSTRLSMSYVDQHSMYFQVAVQWVSHTFWRRLAGVVASEYTLPLRPLRRHISNEAERLLYRQHISVTTALRIYLGDPPRVRPEFTRERRRQHLQNRWEERRTERHERRDDRRERLERRREERGVRRHHRRYRIDDEVSVDGDDSDVER